MSGKIALAPPPFTSEGERVIDPGIAHEVRVLWENGIETFESCEGGAGHAFPEPVVRFFGDHTEGLRAVAIALKHGLKPAELRRFWTIEDGEVCGPLWELTFHK